MQIYYFTSAILDLTQAHSNAIVEMVNAFTNENCSVTLYGLTTNKHLSQINSVLNNKVIKRIKILKEQTGWVKKKLNTITTYLQILLWLISIKHLENDLIFVRGDKAAVCVLLMKSLSFGKIRYIVELHNYEFGKKKPLLDSIQKKILNGSLLAITISEYTKDGWVKNGVSSEKVLVIPSGVNINAFNNITGSRVDLRRELGIEETKRVVTYAGKIGKHRGIEEIAFIAQKNPEIQFYLIGNVEMCLNKYNKISNMGFLGYKPKEELLRYLICSDILLAPYSNEISTAKHMSPLKLMEYMASVTPILIADLPRIRDIVSEEEVTFFDANNPHDLEKKLIWINNNPDIANLKANKSAEKVKRYSWECRVKSILDNIQ